MLEIEKNNFSESKETTLPETPHILVIGVGGGGNNAICRMIESNQQNSSQQVSYAVMNTDLQVLNNCNAEYKIQIGKKLTNGFGAGGDPAIGEASAQESKDEIASLIKDYHMVILTCGMGGGTGTGAISVIAEICRTANILTVAVVTLPFSFESKPRIIAAESGIETLKKNVDTLLIIPNDKLLTYSSKPFYLEDAFQTADTVLNHTITGITNILYNRGIINLDFNDLKMTLSNKGIAHLGIGTCTQDSPILEAVKTAIDSPLLNTTINGATNILINSSGRLNLSDLNEAISYVRELAGENVNIIWGTVTDTAQKNDQIIITLIATGMDKITPPLKQPLQPTATAKKRSNLPPVPPKIIMPDKDIIIPSFLINKMTK